MRRYVGLFLVFTILLTFGNTVSAATWNDSSVGNWSDSSMWTSSTPPVSPSTETVNINGGTATLDIDQSVGIVLLNAAAPGNATLNITTGHNLIINKASTELFWLVKTSAGAGTVNHSAGTVTVGSGSGTGEVRLANAAGATGTYNLSGTGVLDTEVLNKGASSRSGVWNATGGTLVVRNMIYKFGLQSAGLGFNQGTCKLEIGAISTVKAITVGNSTNSDDYTVGAGGSIVFDVASASSFDTILQYGSVATMQGASLIINLGYAATAGTTFDVWTFNDKSKAGSLGTGLGSITAGWAAAWVDTSGDGSTDTLRLTYIPEPATIALLGLGLVALRRNKK
jgi:hypothetical protein